MPQLIDIDYGSFQGMMVSEASSKHPKVMETWLTNPHAIRFADGESLQDVAARTSDALRLFAERHRDHTIVAVGHDSTN